MDFKTKTKFLEMIDYLKDYVDQQSENKKANGSSSKEDKFVCGYVAKSKGSEGPKICGKNAKPQNKIGDKYFCGTEKTGHYATVLKKTESDGEDEEISSSKENNKKHEKKIALPDNLKKVVKASNLQAEKMDDGTYVVIVGDFRLVCKDTASPMIAMLNDKHKKVPLSDKAIRACEAHSIPYIEENEADSEDSDVPAKKLVPGKNSGKNDSSKGKISSKTNSKKGEDDESSEENSKPKGALKSPGVKSTPAKKTTIDMSKNTTKTISKGDPESDSDDDVPVKKSGAASKVAKNSIAKKASSKKEESSESEDDSSDEVPPAKKSSNKPVPASAKTKTSLAKEEAPKIDAKSKPKVEASKAAKSKPKGKPSRFSDDDDDEPPAKIEEDEGESSSSGEEEEDDDEGTLSNDDDEEDDVDE